MGQLELDEQSAKLLECKLGTREITSLLPHGQSAPPSHGSYSAVFLNGIIYSSISEAVCAILLQQYITNFQISFGDNFQVQVGGGRSVDFILHRTVIEYHPVTSREKHRPTQPKHVRRHRHGPSRDAALQDYIRRRRGALNQHEHFREYDLTVCTTPLDLYFLVITRFSENALPTPEEFCTLFKYLSYLVIRETRGKRSIQHRRRAIFGRSSADYQAKAA